MTEIATLDDLVGTVCQAHTVTHSGLFCAQRTSDPTAVYCWTQCQLQVTLYFGVDSVLTIGKGGSGPISVRVDAGDISPEVVAEELRRITGDASCDCQTKAAEQPAKEGAV